MFLDLVYKLDRSSPDIPHLKINTMISVSNIIKTMHMVYLYITYAAAAAAYLSPSFRGKKRNQKNT